MRVVIAAACLALPAAVGAQVRPQDAAPPSTRADGAPPAAARSQWCEDDVTPARKSTCDVYAHRSQALIDLRRRAIATAMSEGGSLGPASRARYQAELDRINERFRRQLRNATLFSVDSTGRSLIG